MLQRAIIRHLMAAQAPDALDRGMARRMCYFLRRALAPGEVALMGARMRLVFAQLPEFVALAQLRLVVNDWPAPRRMSPSRQRCRWGCGAVDEITFSTSWLALCWERTCERIALRLWHASATPHLVVFAVPLGEVDILRTATWAHVVYMILTEARHSPTLWLPPFFFEVVRTQVRSLATRSARCKALLIAG